MSSIKIGNTVKDKVTGFTGIAYQKRTNMDGTIMWGITPKVGEDGKFPEGIDIDDIQLEFVDDGVADIAQPRDESVVIAPGDEVISTFEGGVNGTVKYEVQFLNGCVYLSVLGRPNGKLKDDSAYTSYSPHYYYTKAKKQSLVMKNFLALRGAKPVSTKKPAGPMERSLRRD